MRLAVAASAALGHTVAPKGRPPASARDCSLPLGASRRGPRLAARAAVLAAALAPGAALAASPMQPGLWETTVSVSRAGRVPLVSTDRDCVTQKEIDDGTKSLPKPGNQCELSNVATAGPKTTYDFACRNGPETLSGRAEFAIEATRYDGKVDAVTRRGTEPDVATTMTWVAKRVGDCPQR